jgi:chemotaxis protein CheX
MPEISVDLIQPFMLATIETFQKMLNTTPVAQQYTLNKGSGINNDISGVIGLTGDLLGSVSISFPEETALKSLTAFIGVPITTLDYDSMDAVGELVNIIAGYAKKFIQDYKTVISLPTVIKGKGLQVKEPADVFSFRIPFKSTLGEFDLSVGLKKA